MRSILSGGLSLGKVFDIDIKVHWSLMAIAVILVASWGVSALMFFSILFLTVLLHEFGHCAAARSVGGEAYEIVLWPLGGLAFTSGGRTPLQSIWIALAGPLVHLPIAGLCFYLLYLLGVPLDWNELSPLYWELEKLTSLSQLLLYFAFKIQLLLFVFNVCLPAYPLDGGQILVGLLALDFSLSTTLKVAGVVTLISALVLLRFDITIIGCWVLFEGVRLLSASQDGRGESHPVARLFQTNSVTWAHPVHKAQGSVLVDCAACGSKMHPRSELCVDCGNVTKAPN